MAFMGFEDLVGTIKTSLAKRMKAVVVKSFKETGAIIGKRTEGMRKKWAGMSKAMRKADPYIESFNKGFTALTKAGLDTVGIFLQFAEALGILEPIMNILTGVLQIIGGAAMEAIGPALAEFADILFSDEMMEVWQMLGQVIGEFIAGIMGILSTLFSNPAFQKVMKAFITIFQNVFAVIMNIFGGIIEWLGTMDAAQMGALFYGLGVGIAFLMGVLHGGVAGPILGALYAGIAAIALSPLLGLQTGGITRGMTPALLHPNEAVIPLDSPEAGKMMGSNNEELLWATEDNGRRLDRLVGALETQNKIARLSML